MVQAERAVNRKERTGTVVSDVNDQTVIVSVASSSRHRLYRKVIRRTKRYPVHDPENRATVGDLVVIEECRPISKTKRWRLVEIVTEREVAEVAPESIDEAFVDEVQRSAARAAAEAADEATPAEEVAPAEEAAAEEPAADAPAEDAPADEEPAADAPAEDAPAAETPAEDAPADEAPPAETPAEDAPADEAPADEPAPETPVEEEAAPTEEEAEQK